MDGIGLLYHVCQSANAWFVGAYQGGDVCSRGGAESAEKGSGPFSARRR